MKRKVLAVDLDGTLLDINKNVLQRDAEAIKRWQEAGNILAIDTGRPLSFNEQLKEFGVYPDIYIGGVGSVCEFKDGTHETLFSFSQEIGTTFINLLIEKDFDFILTFDDDYSYCYNEHKRVLWGVMKHDVRNAYKDGKKDGNKFFVFCPDFESGAELTRLVNEKYSHLAKAVHTEVDAVEIMAYGCDKWQGLVKGLNLADFEYDDIYCIGDSRNDFDMLKGAKESFVMSGGAKEVLEIADNVVSSVSEAIDILLSR